MAIAELDTRIRKGAVQSFEDRVERKSNKRRSLRLTEAEVAELQDLWMGHAAEIGFRSSHGAMEMHLLRSEPRTTTRRHVLGELRRCGGRCPEAKLVAALVEDFDMCLTEGLTRYEVRGAIRKLIARGKVERVETPGQNGEPPTKDLRIVKNERGELRMRLALDSVPKERKVPWTAKDESVRLMWETVPVREGDGGKATYELHATRSASNFGRDVTAALETVSDETVDVLKAAYGTPPSSDVYGAGMWHVAAMTAVVREERERIATEAATQRKLETAPSPMIVLGQPCYVNGPLVRTREQVYAWELRRVHADEILHARMRDTAFVAVVSAQADTLLVQACSEFRKARARG